MIAFATRRREGGNADIAALLVCATVVGLVGFLFLFRDRLNQWAVDLNLLSLNLSRISLSISSIGMNVAGFFLIGVILWTTVRMIVEELRSRDGRDGAVKTVAKRNHSLGGFFKENLLGMTIFGLAIGIGGNYLYERIKTNAPVAIEAVPSTK